MIRRLIGLVLLGWLCGVAPAAAQPGPFSDWAAVIVAGDWRAESGAPSRVFDNARRDLTRGLVAAGFSSDHIRQFSAHEARGRSPLKSKPEVIYTQLASLARQTSGGCLVYFTSHGMRSGIVVGKEIWPPSVMAELVDGACGARPTVVVVSACYSGAFVPALAGPNRMVLTASRQDRSSFGCGEDDHYTYFDACMLNELPRASDFGALGEAVQACVARREQELGASPPSEPQLAVGAALRPRLSLYAFSKGH